MAWTYDPSALASSKKDQVRLLAQDTVESDPLLEDEEISLFLALEGDNVYRAAASACDAVALQLAKQETLDSEVKADPQRSSARYSGMAASFRERARTRGAGAPVPFAGGVSRADKQARSGDADSVGPAFKVGLHDGPSGHVAGCGE